MATAFSTLSRQGGMKFHDKSDEFSENLIIDYADYAKFSVRAAGARKEIRGMLVPDGSESSPASQRALHT